MKDYLNTNAHGQTRILSAGNWVSCDIGKRRITISVLNDKAAVVMSEDTGREATTPAPSSDTNKPCKAKNSRRTSGKMVESGTIVHVLRKPTDAGFTMISASVSTRGGAIFKNLRKIWDDYRFQFRRDSEPLTAQQANAIRTPLQHVILNHPIISQFFKICTNGGGLIPVDFAAPIDYFAGVCTIGLPGHSAGKNAALEEFAICGGRLVGHAKARGRSISLLGSVIRDRALIGGDAFIDTGAIITTRAVIGGTMSLLSDDSGAPIVRGDLRLVGDFNLVGSGHLSMSGDPMIDRIDQIQTHVRLVMNHTR